MNERERWIVYPLLFFALGASLRDKFLQHVSTKEVECTRLVAETVECRTVVVRDPANPNQRLVELGEAQPLDAAPGQPSRRFGVLVLRDNDGKELCGVSNNELYVRKINCEGVSVVDPANPLRVLAALTSALPQTALTPDAQRFGVLALNNQEFWQLVGLPKRADEPASKDEPAAEPAPTEPAPAAPVPELPATDDPNPGAA